MSPLERSELDDDPLAQFARWIEEAGALHAEPQAMAIATATPDGRPSARMVLLKRFDERGFVFVTDYNSRKASELESNPRAALLFHWDPPGRQVRIEGTVERTTAAETRELVKARARESRLVSISSRQSEPLDARETLAADVRRLEERYAGRELPVPDDWGGYRVIPESFEFWQKGAARFHDRFRYTAGAGGSWAVQRLYP
ncbi:MAG TPA: pyridoxamine 5'-phosphate oxidase [Solirubrobacteraceae bacterium]|nr:pyridoxamine 5'-phosphate oxidase [Solirubrobacteraceae bacterium]